MGFGGIHVFPAICSYKWIYCKDRQMLSRRIQQAVRSFHENNENDLQEEEEDENTLVQIPESENNKFWRPNYSTRNVSVFRLNNNRSTTTSCSEKDGTEFERALCNQ